MEDAGEALKSNKLFEGKRLRVERAKVNRTLFIAKLSRNTTNGVCFFLFILFILSPFYSFSFFLYAIFYSSLVSQLILAGLFLSSSIYVHSFLILCYRHWESKQRNLEKWRVWQLLKIIKRIEVKGVASSNTLIGRMLWMLSWYSFLSFHPSLPPLLSFLFSFIPPLSFLFISLHSSFFFLPLAPPFPHLCLLLSLLSSTRQPSVLTKY